MRTALALCLLAGCDPVAGTDYVGEPMFALSGTLTSKAPSEDPLELALLWQDSGGAGGPGVAITRVPSALELPSTVRLSIPLPPPDAARFAFDDVELAEAYIGVLAEPNDVRGIDRSHVLVWADRDVEAGTAAADYLGGALEAGYHLRRFVPGAPGNAQRVMIDRCAAAGSTKTACEARRDYQLAEIADADSLRIVVVP